MSHFLLGENGKNGNGYNSLAHKIKFGGATFSQTATIKFVGATVSTDCDDEVKRTVLLETSITSLVVVRFSLKSRSLSAINSKLL